MCGCGWVFASLLYAKHDMKELIYKTQIRGEFIICRNCIFMVPGLCVGYRQQQIDDERIGGGEGRRLEGEVGVGGGTRRRRFNSATCLTPSLCRQKP